MKQTLLSLSLALVAVLTASAYKQQSIDINVNGQSRNMVVFTPNSLPTNSPLFIVTHGMNQDPEYQYGSDKLYEMIDTAKFVVAYLRSDGSTWDTGGTKDQNFVIKTIDEMFTRYEIDKDRVYWSGFSMGSMLIHHCIANMQDKIAAFAPTSGIQFSEQPWNNCSKPVNLLECIAYGDDVFGYEKYGIHAYIENYAKHDKHPNYKKITGYRPFNGCWYDGDLEKWTGGPDGGEVWLYSYNNGGHWPMTDNRQIIWNFCKRFSLHPTAPKVKITKPTNEITHLCMAPKGEATFPDVTISATASDPNGTIEKVTFYDNGKSIETLTTAPFQATLTNATAAKHELSVTAIDNDGEKAQASCFVNYAAPERLYYFHNAFNGEGIVPQGWYVSNGTNATKRAGGNNSYSDGPRILRFTNASKAFEYGLLIQNGTSRAKTSYAKFGIASGHSTMTLHQGRYAVKYKICNWDRPEFSPVTVNIEKRSGEVVASQTYKPTVNLGGDVSTKFARVGQQTLEFDAPETDDYVLVIYTDGARNADFVLGYLSIQTVEFGPTGINRPTTPSLSCQNGERWNGLYDLSGRRMQRHQLRHGLYIINGQKTVIL